MPPSALQQEALLRHQLARQCRGTAGSAAVRCPATNSSASCCPGLICGCCAPCCAATSAGCVMSVMLGVILAHTGTLAAALIQPHTSPSTSQSWPMAMPILRSGRPCGQLKLISNASTPTSSQRPMISCQASLASSQQQAGRMQGGCRQVVCQHEARLRVTTLCVQCAVHATQGVAVVDDGARIHAACRAVLCSICHCLHCAP